MTYTPKEEAEWFRKLDKAFGAQLEEMLEGDEASFVDWDRDRWDVLMKYARGPLQKRILFDPDHPEEFGEKHPLYKHFEAFNRGCTEVVPGQPPPLYDPRVIATALYLLFTKAGDRIEDVRSFLKVKILEDPERAAEIALRAAGALDGVP